MQCVRLPRNPILCGQWRNARSLRTAAFAISVLLQMVVISSVLRADVPEVAASPDTAARAIFRAEQFFRDVASMSPCPKVDPDRGQLWPRLDYFEFLDRTDGSVSRYARPESPTVVAYRYGDNPCNGPGWTVYLYGKQISITLDSNCQIVQRVVDGVFTHAIGHDPAPAETECISPAVALDRAIRYLRLGGIDTSGLVLQGIRLADGSIPADAASRTYSVQFDKTWQGVRILEQSVVVQLDADQGRLILYGGAGLNLLLPSNGQVEISLGDAISIARRRTVQLNLVPTFESSASLVVARPNLRGGIGEGSQTRLCWNVITPIETTPGGATAQILRIDVSTGEIIGGDQNRVRGGGSAPIVSPALMNLLTTARTLEVRLATGRGPRELLRVITPSVSSLAYFGALNGFLPASSASPERGATQQILVHRAATPPVVLRFDSHSNELWDDNGNKAKCGESMKRLLLGQPAQKPSRGSAPIRNPGIGVRSGKH